MDLFSCLACIGGAGMTPNMKTHQCGCAFVFGVCGRAYWTPAWNYFRARRALEVQEWRRTRKHTNVGVVWCLVCHVCVGGCGGWVEGSWGSATRETLPRQLTMNEFSKKLTTCQWAINYLLIEGAGTTAHPPPSLSPTHAHLGVHVVALKQARWRWFPTSAERVWRVWWAHFDASKWAHTHSMEMGFVSVECVWGGSKHWRVTSVLMWFCHTPVTRPNGYGKITGKNIRTRPHPVLTCTHHLSQVTIPVSITTYTVFYHRCQCFTTTLITLYKHKCCSDHLQIHNLRGYKY